PRRRTDAFRGGLHRSRRPPRMRDALPRAEEFQQSHAAAAPAGVRQAGAQLAPRHVPWGHPARNGCRAVRADSPGNLVVLYCSHWSNAMAKRIPKRHANRTDDSARPSRPPKDLPPAAPEPYPQDAGDVGDVGPRDVPPDTRAGRDGGGGVAAPSVRVRMYRQGLGDCFLVTFNPNGGANARHMLIDCGTLGATTTGVKLAEVVASIGETTDHHLHVVVCT